MSFVSSLVRLCSNVFLLSFLFSFSFFSVYGGGKGKEAIGEDGERPTAYILTVAGGGLRGVIPAKILSLMEERLQHKLNKGKPVSEHTPVRLADFFDVVAGTSTGGIIVSALNTPVACNDNQPRTSKDILRFYTDHAEEIFPSQGVVARAKSYIWSQYSQDPLVALLRETFGEEAWLSDCLTDMIIPTYDMRGGLPYTFRTSDARKYASSNFRVYESLLATSAAPTYFDSVKIKNKEGEERVFSDGGTAANNPMLEALRRAVKKYKGHNIVVISLGTGRIPMESIERLSKAGKGYYAPALAKLFMDNSESRAREAFDGIRQMLEGQGLRAEHIYINPHLPKKLEALDQADNVDDLVAVGSRVSNRANRDEYPIFKAAISHMMQAHRQKERARQNEDNLKKK